MKSPRLRQTVFRLKISSFLAFSTFEKGFLWHSRWGGGVTRANFCITRGSLSWLVAPRDAKIGTRDTTPSPLVPQKALFKGLEGPKDWFSAEKQFALPQTFHVVLTNIIKYYFGRFLLLCNGQRERKMVAYSLPSDGYYLQKMKVFKARRIVRLHDAPTSEVPPKSFKSRATVKKAKQWIRSKVARDGRPKFRKTRDTV